MAKQAHLRLIDCRASTDPSLVAVLRVLLAKALKGDLRGILVSYQDRESGEQFLSTGIYSSRPETAAAAALRMAHRFADAGDQ